MANWLITFLVYGKNDSRGHCKKCILKFLYFDMALLSISISNNGRNIHFNKNLKLNVWND